ncbi:major facilitator superfamily domain-containing protein 12-like isoform X1 [Eurytemora carolleeae]|uniref:major facilitator superfamily domain-containing protein 12-like isoform X1 n=1 Tax=Eurytemora carolleeae TaxID=1294199 RepID=UPI000C77C773|nr:major facilitator superfamily domain-containing protein 12-like isoform X1 [Eurytemora carolleeae]|eukprot:XP_023341716.1 major facilitator superfamily domain-containing protein 12-like isoform X1 [Eurytemora affinis]
MNMLKSSDLSWSTILGYGVGHIFNDICASMWFTYLLLFFQKVLYFQTVDSGVLLLVGQIADGISTTIVGILASKLSNLFFCRKYGGRKSWHLIGSACVLVSFPFIFLPCIGCETALRGTQMFYYSCFIILFQFGWACVQISHLALVTQLSDKGETRTLLTSLRYLGTVVANVLVYAVTWLFFGLEGGNNDISSKDSEKFRNVMLVGVGVGCVTTALFHILVREPDTRSFQQERTCRSLLRP